MLKVGLTGGLGSGKSTVAKVFETLGIPVYYADDAAKRLMDEDAALNLLITKNFGSESYLDEVLNRPYLASVVFRNPEKLALLNSLVHPVTFADSSSWMKLQQTPYAIKEAALIFESNAHLHLDCVIGVSAPYQLRLQRGMQRDHSSSEAVEERMKNQLDEEIKMQRCDYIIYNDETALIIPQVMKLHQILISKNG